MFEKIFKAEPNEYCKWTQIVRRVEYFAIS